MISDIFLSFKNSIDAIGYLLKPWVFKYLIISGIISLLTFSACFFLIYSFGVNLANGIINSFSEGLKWNWLTSIIEWLTRLILFAGVIFIMKYIILIVTAPIMSTLSEQVERRLTNVESDKLSMVGQVKGITRGSKLSISNLLRESILLGILFIVSLIPGVAFITSILFFVVGAYYAGFGNIDYTLERHYNYNDSIAFVRKNRGFAIGNGIIFMLFLLIPIIGIILVLPLSVTAASTQTVEQIKAREQLNTIGIK